jgi:hypothetical protein
MPFPRLNSISLEKPICSLREITKRNEKTGEGKAFSPIIAKLKESFINNLKTRLEDQPFESVTASENPQRTMVLLSIYLEYFDKHDSDWLPKFNDNIAYSILGSHGSNLSPVPRNQLTILFFTHFNRLPALNQICARLIESYQSIEGSMSRKDRALLDNADLIFSLNGPQSVADAANSGESILELMQRFAIRLEGQFAARLKECFLLQKIQNSKVGEGEEILNEIKLVRDSPYQSGMLLGAAALKIMTQKVLKSGGAWGVWADWMLEIGCDPNRIRSNEFPIWWGAWHPTREELECAQRGLRSRTLEYFIKALEDSLREIGKCDQFESRARFLRWLDATDKIEDFKLILTSVHFESLPKAHRKDNTSIKRFTNTNRNGASIIVLKCTDGVWLSEGTHSYAIRVFKNTLPIRDVFSENRNFTYAEFISGTMHKDICEKIGIWETHLGDWVNRLIKKIRFKYNVEWYLHNY